MLNPLLASMIQPEGLILITGDIGSGKSCLAYSIMEDMHLKTKKPCYVYNFPKPEVLPKWLRNTTDPELPEDSIVIIDEAYIFFHSRTSMREQSRFIDQFTGLVRQKGILAIFVTQMTRKLDRGIVGSSQGLLIKKLSRMNVRLDRSDLKPILEDAYKAFKELPPEVDPRKCVYALMGDFEGIIINSNWPPTFWTDDMSKAWKGVSFSGDVSNGARNVRKNSGQNNNNDLESIRKGIMEGKIKVPRWLHNMLGIDAPWEP